MSCPAPISCCSCVARDRYNEMSEPISRSSLSSTSSTTPQIKSNRPPPRYRLLSIRSASPIRAWHSQTSISIDRTARRRIFAASPPFIPSEWFMNFPHSNHHDSFHTEAIPSSIHIESTEIPPYDYKSPLISQRENNKQDGSPRSYHQHRRHHTGEL